MNDSVFTAAAISAYHATHMLDQARIQALIRARDWLTAAKLLAECGYTVTDTSIEHIIENERIRTFNMFCEHCSDIELENIMREFYKFRTSIIGKNQTLNDAELELKDIITANIHKIDHPLIKQYFKIYIDAWNHGEKVPDERLWRIAHELRFDLNGTGVLFYWYAYKQAEFMAVRTILTGKRFNMEREQIMENLKRIYDRFK